MLLNITALLHWRVAATDGDAGPVVDILFDPTTWRALHLVVDAEAPSGTTRVLLPISAVSRRAGEFGHLDVALSRLQVVQQSADGGQRLTADLYQPPSTLNADAASGAAPVPWGAAVYAGALAPVAGQGAATDTASTASDEVRAMAETLEAQAEHETTLQASAPHHSADLQSCRDAIGSRVEASDGDAGDVDDMAIDDQGWSIPYLIVDARRWWPGGRVLVKPTHVTAVHRTDRVVSLNLTQAALRELPPADG